MKKSKLIAFSFVALSLASCSYFKTEQVPEEPPVPTRILRPAFEKMIALQNLETRVIIYCADSPRASAEMCARNYERVGFVRLTQIPSRPAADDFLKADTYPTRRWRKDDVVPRW